ncbi:NnrS family protein [Nitrogeniibacter mangrovi]|uniref:NnrS family protein n=1 Tax=Nitrogeniibacter mangrovi TaxID=2016596 RepID=A0A6C1B0R9_9RHOO|nr:NnrS family protein [Nitrogeniibacter mangrovi]QID17211.1 NnrS family protein [Nitrogeniibacter mangrovi]
MNETRAPSRRAMLLVAPHRGMFFLGMLQCVLVMLPWWVEMILRAAGQGLAWPWPAPWWHAVMLLYGVFPFFVFGFLLTAMPRWQSHGDLAPSRYVWCWAVLVAGWGLIYAAFLWPLLRIPGVVLVGAGWAGVCAVLFPVMRRPGRGRLHAVPVWAALCAGLAGWSCVLMLALGGDGRWAAWAIDLGLWACLLPIFLSVCHRMVPFFSSSVLPDYTMVRPAWALWVLVAGSVLHGALNRLGLAELTWLVDLPMAAVGGWLTVSWQLRRSFAVRLLAMLHVGFAWFGVAMALFGVQSLLAFFGVSALGLAPLHVLVIGMFTVLALGMVSRVTLGHSGAALKADGLTWALSWAVQGVLLLRVAAELLPGAPLWLVFAATGWLCVFVLWTLRYLPVYLRPRVDGRDG